MSDDILRQLLAALDEQVTKSTHTVSDQLASLSKLPEVALFRQALRAPRDVARAAAMLEDLRKLANRLRREGLDPALGIIGLAADSLDGLEALLSTESVPLSPELSEVRRQLYRLRHPPVVLDISLPAYRSEARVAGDVVRALVFAEPAVSGTEGDRLDLAAAVTAAAESAIARTRAFDPRQTVDVHAELRGDLLIVRIVDHGRGDIDGDRQSTERANRYFDRVVYQSGDTTSGGSVEMTKQFEIWPGRRSGAES